MEKDRSKLNRIIIYSLISLEFVVMVLLAVYFMNAKQNSPSSDVFDMKGASQKFTMYIGTNDKETYSRLIPLEECSRRIDSICMKYVDGFSSDVMEGKWVDETGAITEEVTFVYIFYDTTDEIIKKIMDEVLVALNQNSILLEKEYVRSSFYNGK